MPVTLDPCKGHATCQHCDLLCFFTSVDTARAMIPLPALRLGASWYIALGSAASQYDDYAYVARLCVTACGVVGIEHRRPIWLRGAGIIHRGLRDRVKMPRALSADFHLGSFGCMTPRVDGHVLAQQHIRIEREGVTCAQ